MKTYIVTYEVVVEVTAENKDAAQETADQNWWSDGEITDCRIEEA